MNPKRKPTTCAFYNGGLGICYKGEKCDFSHCDTTRSSLEIETAGDSRFTFAHLIRSLVGGDDEKAIDDFLKLLKDYLKSKITVRLFLVSTEKANLSHILPDVAKSLKVTNPDIFSELSSAIDRSVKEKEISKREQEKRKEEFRGSSCKPCASKTAQEKEESPKKLCCASKTTSEEDLKKLLIQKDERRKQRAQNKQLLSFSDQEDREASSSWYKLQSGKHGRQAELEDPIGAILVRQQAAKTNNERRKQRAKNKQILSFNDQEDDGEASSSSSSCKLQSGKHGRHKESEDTKAPQRRRAELEDPLGAILVRQQAAKTNNDLDTDTLAQRFMAECRKVVAPCANPLLITIGAEKTVKSLIAELKNISKEVKDCEIASVAAASADAEIGNVIAEAMMRVGRKGVVILEEGKGGENALCIVEGLQFEHGYLSPSFVTDSEKKVVDFDHCNVLLFDKKITNADIVGVVELAIRGVYPLLVVAQEIELEALANLVGYKLRGTHRIAAIKAPGFGELKSQYLDDIAILTGGTVIRDSLDKSGKEVLGHAAKVVLTKETSTIVGDGSTHDAVQKHVTQIKNLIEQAEQGYEKEKLNERISKLSAGVAVIQVGAETEAKLKVKKLSFENALKATKAAVEEGVVGGGCVLLHLASKVDVIKDSLDNDEKVGADIVKKGLTYPLKRISENAGEKVLSNGDLMAAKVVRCCLENSVKVLRTFFMSHQGA